MLFNPIENVWKYNYFSVIQSVALPVQELVAGEVDDTVRGEVICNCNIVHMKITFTNAGY